MYYTTIMSTIEGQLQCSKLLMIRLRVSE